MFERKRRPTPPGAILEGEFLQPKGVTVSAFARQLGISRKHLSDIVHERVRVTPHVAALLAHALGTSTALWVNLQAAVDIWEADRAYRRRRKEPAAGARS
jgi:addiction module HigA family antidote